MKTTYSLLILATIFCGCKSSKDSVNNPPDNPNNSAQLLYFKFNETSGNSSLETKTGSTFSINTSSGDAERIDGLEGKALRSNGYYGWASGTATVTYPFRNICISGWVAPQAFPVQRKNEDAITENTNAAIFTNINPSNSAGIALGINHHGKVIGQFKVGNTVKEIVSNEVVQLKKWNFIALNINASDGNAKLYLDGQEIETISFAIGDLQFSSSSTIYLGKESKTKTVAGFDTNGLTGAIDEVSVWNKNLTNTEILGLYSAYNPQTPDLKIPIAARFDNDIHRPKYHLMPTAGWSNETHGLFYLDGKYNIFSQRNFNGPYLEHINWGHYTSTDLINWEEKNQILWPQPGFDEVGIWSGHAIIKNNQPFVFYTGVNKVKAAIGLATSISPYENWTKNSTPIITAAPTALANADFRDPFVFQNGTDYYMMIGTGIRTGTHRGGLFLYKATNADFTSWSYQGTMAEGNPSTDGTGDFWEMPVYYNFGTKAILLVNKLPNANALYWTGSFNGNQFIKDNAVPERLDVINQLLSPSINTDANGNVIAIGIIPDVVASAKHKEQGWANVFSLPRVWTLVNNKIKQVPHPNLLNLRGGNQSFSNVSFSSTSSNVLNNAFGTQYEIVATLDPGTATKVGFTLHKNSSGTERTNIYYDYSSSSFVVERANSSSLANVPITNQASSYNLPSGPVNWRIFVDASVIEVFINEELAFTTRVFPSIGSNQIDLYAQGGNATATSLTIYNIQGGGVTSTQKLINSETIKKKIKVYPNPSDSEFNIEFENTSKVSLVQAYVFDVSGHPVKYLEGIINSQNNSIQWDGNTETGLKAKQGVYLVKGILNGEFFETKLILK